MNGGLSVSCGMSIYDKESQALVTPTNNKWAQTIVKVSSTSSSSSEPA